MSKQRPCFRSLIWETVETRLSQGSISGRLIVDAASGQGWTADELLAKVHQVAGAIASALVGHSQGGVQDEDSGPLIIGLHLPQSCAYIVHVLATLACGAAFLPLDTGWPKLHLQRVVRQARPSVIITHDPAELKATVSGTGTGTSCSAAHASQGEAASGAPGDCLQASPTALSPEQLLACPAPDTHGSMPQQQQHPASHSAVGSLDLPYLPFCYVIYTSGSTGTPSGVCGTEAGVLNRCSWMQQSTKYGLRPEEGHVVAVKTSISFVDSVWEMLGPLLSGTPLVILPSQVVLRPRHLLDALAQHTVSHYVSVPSLLRLLVAAAEQQQQQVLGKRGREGEAGQAKAQTEHGQQLEGGLKASEGVVSSEEGRAAPHHSPAHQQPPGFPASLVTLVSSGEPLPVGLASRLTALLPPGATLLNLYGSTEVAADCTWAALPAAVSKASGAARIGTDSNAADKAGNSSSSSSVYHTSTQNATTPQGSWSAYVDAGAPIANMAVFIAPSTLLPSSHPGAPGTSPASGASADAASGGAHKPAGDAVLQSQPADQTHSRVQEIEPVAWGTVGEVCVAGAGLAAGYLHDPGLTRSRFNQAAVPAKYKERVLWGPRLSLPLPLPLPSFPRSTAEVQLPASAIRQQKPPAQPAQLPLSTSEDQQLPAPCPPATPDQQLHPSLAGLLDARQGARVFRTGDLGVITPSGVLHILGRKDHQVKVGGARVDLLAVEACLNAHPLVAEAAVLLVGSSTPASQAQQQLKQQDAVHAGDESRQRLCAYVVLRQDGQQQHAPVGSAEATGPMPSAAAAAAASLAPEQASGLVSWVRQHLPAPSVPSQWVVITPHLPRNPAGKLLRGQLLQPPYWPPAPSSSTLQPAAVQPAAGTHANPSDQGMQPLTGTAVAVVKEGSSRGEHGRDARWPDKSGSSGTQPAAPPPGSEAAVMAAFLSVLNDPSLRLEPTDDIFAAGATSLQAAAIAGALGVDVRLVLAAPRARQLAALMRNPQAAEQRLTQQQQQQEGERGEKLQPLDNAPPAAGADTTGVVSMEKASGAQGSRPAKVARVDHESCSREVPPPVVMMNPATGAGPSPGCALSVDDLASALEGACWVEVATGGDQQAEVVPWRRDSPQSTGFSSGASKATYEARPAVTVQPSEPAPAMTAMWRAPMGRCVDAPLVVVTLFGSRCHPGTEQQTTLPAEAAGCHTSDIQLSHTHLGTLVLACSHDGDVRCLDAATGQQLWLAQLPARADAGLCVHPGSAAVWVACGDGTLTALDLVNGQPYVIPAGHPLKVGLSPSVAEAETPAGSAAERLDVSGCLQQGVPVSVSLGGEPRSPPVTDPWGAGVWATSHGDLLLGVASPVCSSGNGSSHQRLGQVVARATLPAPSSCSPSFCPSSPAAVYVGCLDGSVTAWSCQHLVASGGASEPSHTAHHDNQRSAAEIGSRAELAVLWSWPGSSTAPAAAPVFSRPCVCQPAGVLVVAHVDGTVRGLSLATGQQVWVTQLSGNLFASLMLCPGSEDGPGDCRLLTGVLVCSHDGSVTCLSCRDGGQVWRVTLGNGRVSCAPAWWLTSSPTSSSSSDATPAAPVQLGAMRILLAFSRGVLTLLEVFFNKVPDGGTLAAHEDQVQQQEQRQQGAMLGSSSGSPEFVVRVLEEVSLPGELFSSPSLIGWPAISSSAGFSQPHHHQQLWAILGCRDDAVWAVRVN